MATIATELIETKRDERGRQIRSAEERESLLQAYRESGLTPMLSHLVTEDVM